MNTQSIRASLPSCVAAPPSGLPTMEKKASEHYTLERVTTGPVFRAQYLLVVKSGDARRASQVILTTGDSDRALRVEQRVRRALVSLSVSEFESFIGMNRRIRAAADVLPLPS